VHPFRRYDSRRPINHSIAPGPLTGTTERFVVENLSTGGMSLSRAAPANADSVDKKALDERFAWLTVPLPGSDTKVTALIEVVHRERHGDTELIRVRFEEMPFMDRVHLCDYLERRDRQEFCGLD
jgi:c-di-GMP-binding flagellar brake protein YcgR